STILDGLAQDPILTIMIRPIRAAPAHDCRHRSSLLVAEGNEAAANGSRYTSRLIPDIWTWHIHGSQVGEQLSRMYCFVIRHPQQEVARRADIALVRSIDHYRVQFFRSERSNEVQQCRPVRNRELDLVF